MRSWYLVMCLFLGVILSLILLLGSLNNGCTPDFVSLMTEENTSSGRAECGNGENALPWQLDAVSLGSGHTPTETDIPSSNVQEISCAIRTGPVKSECCN
jgi:hypothetical protein